MSDNKEKSLEKKYRQLISDLGESRAITENVRGSIFPIEVNTSATKKDGNIVGFLAVIKDITKRKLG